MTPKDKKTYGLRSRGGLFFRSGIVQNTPYIPKKDMMKNTYIYDIKDSPTIK
ncbi:hypothetical protein CLV42_102500 [Chitinophaga ginsengisoli]|uniref:Uncharacterized protein n=1 Tax=Chitinophaga ginsengisoli TaxID=363837 RepID=A0A2P8GLT8_9BACT|nr:hypothetical protein CLV42_102500 [Chitinophaga ginsengisoli]